LRPSTGRGDDGVAIILDVTVDGGMNRPVMGAAGRAGPAQNVPRHTFQIAFDATHDWRLVPPMSLHWRHLFGDAMGRWYKDAAGTWIGRDRANKATLFEVRRLDQLRGEFFYWPRAGNRGAVLYDGSGSWKPTDVAQPKTWVGFAVKGGGGAAVGAELCLAAMIALWGKNNSGCTFACKTGRLGLVAGFSGGIALVFATGFTSASEVNGYTSDGADFALAVGPKIAGAVNPQWARLAAVAKNFDHSAEMVEGLVKGAGRFGTLRGELPGIAKLISQSALIDYDEKNITVLDVPMCGVGTELGIYYGWSSVNVLSTW
jgi:hypothetical protein